MNDAEGYDAADIGTTSAGTPRATGSAGMAGTTGGPTVAIGGAAGSRGPGAGGTATPRATGTTPRTTGATPRSTGTTPARHGRRERARPMAKPSFFQRFRTAIVIIAVLVGVALLSTFVFVSASQAAYACTTIWTPSPTPAPAAGATPQLGYVQPDMGRDHVNFGQKVTYTYCPPASGSHDNKSGAGPIAPRVYGPGDVAIPEGWIHNLEHGAMVILYKGTGPGATSDGQAQLKALYDNFPPGPVCGDQKGLIGPIIARFDDMATPFAALVWGRVFPLDTFDQAKILAFWSQWGERTNPEDQCPGLRSSPSPGSAAPSGSTAPASPAAPAASPAASAAPTAAPTAAPSTTAPSSSAAPSPS